MDRFTEKHWSLLPVALLCVSCVYLAIGLPVHDFANYYFGGKFLGEHRFTSDIYFPYWFNRQIVAEGHAPLFAGFAPNTPVLALVFYPFSLLSVSASKIMFNLVSVGLFLLSMKRLANFYKIGSIYLFLIPVLFLIPIRNEIVFGQVYFLVFVCLSESWLAHEKKQSVTAALFLAIAIMLKVFPVLLLFYFLFNKDFKLVAYTIFGCIFLALATWPFCPIETWSFYLTEVLGKASNGEIASAYVANYQSAFMFLKQWLVFDPVENPAGWLSDPMFFTALIFAFKIMVIAIGYYITKNADSRFAAFSYWIFACLLISPYGSTYTFILMLFLYFATVQSNIAQWKKISMLILIFLLSNLPLSLFLDSVFPISYLRFFILIAFFGLLVSHFWKSIDVKMVSALVLVAVVWKVISFEKQNPGDYFLPNGSPLLVLDYTIENQVLRYFYWNEEGENTTSVPMPFVRIEPADLIRNQIYYRGKKIVYNQSRKLKPMVIDGKTLIYLTDSQRGIGFYTIRKVDLR